LQIYKNNYLSRFDEKWNCYFLLNYVTRFPENQSESESRIVRLIGNIFLGSRPWLKKSTNWLLVIFDDRNTTNNQRYFLIYLIVSFQVCCRKRTNLLQSTGKLYHMRLWVECTLFCNLQSRARTHAVLVIGLYELLDPTT
jgi:hypothetical protein